ncbi:unnamed protein product [Coregonus sp. 'balchen']|nr:unnamed protein product [Coregonus sp. 'balchen']
MPDVPPIMKPSKFRKVHCSEFGCTGNLAMNPNFMVGVNSTRPLFTKVLLKELVIPRMQRRTEGCCNLPKVNTEAMERCGVMKESRATTTKSSQGQKRKRCQLCPSAMTKKSAAGVLIATHPSAKSTVTRLWFVTNPWTKTA